MTNPSKLIVALDVPTLKDAKVLIDKLEVVDIFKVGIQLFTSAGPSIVEYLIAHRKKVFLDLKFHDIPNTVGHAVTSAVQLSGTSEGILMCTLHTVGGKEMLMRAVEAATKSCQAMKIKRPLLVGVTVLTSEAREANIRAIVLERARLAQESGLDGVVASSEEAEFIRREFGKDFIIVTPGIRPAGSDHGDQKRVTTPAQAIANGSNYLVVGRPIVEASDPAFAAKKILEEISI